MKTFDHCMEWVENNGNLFINILFGIVYSLIVYMIYQAIHK